MGGIATAVFEPGDRALDDIEADLERSVADHSRNLSRTVFQNDGRVVWKFKGAQTVFKDDEIAVECDRVLYLGIGDTAEWGHGILFEWNGNGYEVVESHSDEDMGASTCEFFLEKFGIRGYRGRYADRDGPFAE